MIQSKKNQKGATAVEFALIVSFLFLLIFAIIEIGLLVYNKHVLTNASREGTRAGIVVKIPRVTDNEIQTIVGNYASAFLITFGNDKNLIWDTNSITRIDLDGDGVLNEFGEPLIVKAKYPYKFLFLSGFGFNDVTLNSATIMRME